MIGIGSTVSRLRKLTRTRGFLVGLGIFFLLANVFRAFELRLDLIPDRLWSYLPVATSNIYFGHKADYAGYTDVLHQMDSTVLGKPDQNDAFRAFLSGLPQASVDRAKEYGLQGSDDKGLVDYFRLSLALFGLNSYGFLLTYFLILAISLTAYFVAFYEAKWPLWVALFFLASHWAILPNLQIDEQVQTIYSNRFLPVLGLIATLHLILAPFLKLSSKRQAVTSIVQCSILVFVAHLRTSALWEIGCVVIVSLAALAQAVLGSGFRKPLFVLALPVVLSLFFQVAKTAYLERAFSPIYQQPEHMAKRSVWHSILTGFSFSPNIHQQLGFKVDDASVRNGVKAWLENSGRVGEWKAIQGNAAPGVSDHWLYERASKEYLAWVVRKYPLDILKGIVLYKPVALAKEYLWLNGFMRENGNLSLLAPGHAEQVKEMTKIIRNRPPFAVPLYWVIGWIFLLAGFTSLSRIELRNIVLASLLLLGMTLIPTLVVAFPLAYSSSEAILAITLVQRVFYGVIAFGVATLVARQINCLSPRGSDF